MIKEASAQSQKMYMLLQFVLLFLFGLKPLAQAGNVLVLCPVSSPSHKNVFEPIFTGLAERGHSITVVSSVRSKPQKNIRNIIPYDDFDYFPNLSAIQLRQMGAMGILAFNYTFLLNFCEAVYDNEEFMGLINKEFDLVLMDAFFHQCLLGFVYKLGAPLVLVSPMPVATAVSIHVGNRQPPSFVPPMLARVTHNMSFHERTLSALLNILTYYSWRRPFGVHENIYRKRLGDENLPDAETILNNVSMILSNSHFTFNFPRPVLPDLIEIGGAHCRQGKALPKDIAEFADEASNGLILFSLGSIVKPHELPEETRKAFVSVFSRLKQRVLWKWPEDISDLPSNIKLLKWIPQQDVLAHPNTRLFMTHAGLLSTQEAIYHGVPMISIPIFADQDLNAFGASQAGIAVTMEILNATADSIAAAISEVLNGVEYRENVKRMSKHFRDQPLSPKDLAVFWAEYVMRHKGATHLRSAARGLNFWQYYCIDVAAVVASVFLIFASIVFAAVRVILRVSKRLVLKSTKPSKMKRH